jgi:hypothetical protein
MMEGAGVEDREREGILIGAERRKNSGRSRK